MSTIVLEQIDEGKLWQAYLADADHCVGSGVTPEEAIGFLCLNHPQRMGIDEYRWQSPIPQLPGHPTEMYPRGVQESFDHLPKRP